MSSKMRATVVVAVISLLVGCASSGNETGNATGAAPAAITNAPIRLQTQFSEEPATRITPIAAVTTVNEDVDTTATRLFAGPSQYPPRQFKAYGIVAFRSSPTSFNRVRYKMICEAYVSGIPHASEVDASRANQMVTVWPLKENSDADRLNSRDWLASSSSEKTCAVAVDQYGLAVARYTLKRAQRLAKTGAQGPFLLAWSPSSDIGKPSAPVLVADLSYVTTFDQAQEAMQLWASEIEGNPALWEKGWSVEGVRVAAQRWLDREGTRMLELVGAAN